MCLVAQQACGTVVLPVCGVMYVSEHRLSCRVSRCQCVVVDGFSSLDGSWLSDAESVSHFKLGNAPIPPGDQAFDRPGQQLARLPRTLWLLNRTRDREWGPPHSH
jgi:hypothetical protein